MRSDLVVLLSITGLAVISPTEAAYDVPRCHGRAATIVGTEKADRIEGTDKADVIVGLAGDDRIHSLDGRDVVCGGDGRDLIRGGDGDDLLDGQRDKLTSDRGGSYLAGDVLEGGPGDDRLVLGRDRRATNQGRDGELVTFRHSATPVTIVIGRRTALATGEGTDRIAISRPTRFEGSRHDDVITGGPGDDDVVGGGGNDTVGLRSGADSFSDSIDPSDDRPVVGRDDDIVDGGPGRDGLWSTSGVDLFHGGPGADSLSTDRDGTPALYGDAGRDEIAMTLAHSSGAVGVGGPGRDSLYLGRADEIDSRPLPPSRELPDVSVDMTAGTVATAWESGVTTAAVDAFHEVWLSNNVRLTYVGSSLSETLNVPAYLPARVALGAGDDLANGGSRADTFDGGDGFDTVYGGPGDSCVAVEETHRCPAP